MARGTGKQIPLWIEWEPAVRGLDDGAPNPPLSSTALRQRLAGYWDEL